MRSTFAWTVPFLSWLAIAVLVVVGAVLYLVPLRWLVLAWGVNKFAKKLVRPHSLNNNELLDFLSRVPDSEELVRRFRFVSVGVGGLGCFVGGDRGRYAHVSTIRYDTRFIRYV